jgi:hypothetical protein
LWTFELVGAAAWTTVAVLWWARAGVRWPSAIGLLWTLALLEYVNYFHRQLMYDSPSELRWWLRHRRLKTSWLARDLAASEPPRAPPGSAPRRTPPPSS